MLRPAFSLTVAVSLLAVAACADSTAPSSAKSAPAHATNTRYILASGETPPGDCRYLGNGLWLCDDGNQLQPQARTTAPKPEDDNSGN